MRVYKKGDKGSGGNSDFFKTSAVNLLAASIYFWSRYENWQIFRFTACTGFP